jgi:hypothetical protein
MPAEMIERVTLAFNIPMCKTVIIREKQTATAQLLLGSGDHCAEFARSSRFTLSPLQQLEKFPVLVNNASGAAARLRCK